MLQEKKLIEKLEQENNENNKNETFKKFREQTAKQRQKIKGLKTDTAKDAPESPLKETQLNLQPEQQTIVKLTKENLQKNDDNYSSKNKGSQKTK